MEAKARHFKVKPNNQMSKLGDGDSTLKASGEIDTILYRNDIPLRFRALVCDKLHCSVIGGTLLIKENGIKQDFVNNTISLLNDRCIVPATTLEATLPVAVHHPHTPRKGNIPLISLKSKQILLSGDTIQIPTSLPNQQVIAEGWQPAQ